jgi:hypothetical protein
MKLKQQQHQIIVLNNPFPQGQNLQGGSSNLNQQGGTSSAPQIDGYQGVVSMLSHKKIYTIDLMTINRDYNNPELIEKGKNASEF